MQGDRTTLNSDSWKEPFNPSEPGTISSAVINESAARRLSNDSRQQISDSTIRNAKQQEYRVVAVYKDNAFLNLRASAEPTVFLPASNKSAYFLHIKFDESASPELLEREVNEIWRSVFPDAPISYSFVQKRIAREFEPEERYIAYLLLVTIIASALGCLGVFGIISDYRRLAIKGLMIRKLLGAQTWRLYMIPFKELFPPLLAAGLAVSLLIQTYFYPWLELYVARISKITVIAGSAFVYILYSILLAAMIVAVMSKELNESPARKLTT
jgi:putative ABC transport system permease protein